MKKNIFYEIKYFIHKLTIVFIRSSIARNIISVLLECLVLASSGYLTYLIITTPINKMNLLILCTYFIPLFLLKRLALRLKVTNVCPQCQENRGIYFEIYKTGETSNYCERINGDYWEHSQDVECIRITRCHFCSFKESETYWITETWKGELTEEARIRKEEEARLRQIAEYERAQTRAQVEAWEQISRRKRGY